MKLTALLACAAGIWAIALNGVVSSSSLPAADQGAGGFRSTTDLVEVYATVRLRDDSIVNDLTREEFELREDGRVQEIAVFSKSVQPLSVAIVLDHSGSTDEEFHNVRAAAAEFVAFLLPGDRASVGTLAWDCTPFTNDRALLLNLVGATLPRDYGSPIWSATDRAMTALAAEENRRIVLLLSDGENTPGPSLAGAPSSPFTQFLRMGSPCEPAAMNDKVDAGDLVDRAERESTMVYTVSVGRGTRDLSRLADRSGARSQRLGSYNDLRNAFRSIVNELHLQYLLGFVPTKFDGKRHEIDVRTTRKGARVTARQAYVAAKRN